MSKEKYLNFPIQLLSGFMIDTRKVLNDIIDYAVYQNSLKLELGTDLEKIKTSASFYNMTLGNNKNTFDNGKMLYNSLPENSPKVGLSISMFWDFYKNDKSEFDKICLLAFLGIKSILGTKSYCKVTNLYLWARMDGKTNTIVEVSELSNEVRKYANRYQSENIKNELILNWHLIYYSRFTRGFYVSLKMTLEDLIFEAEKKRKSIKENQYKQLKNEALKKALDRLKTTTN
ncbi:hypothetical protein SL054_002207 [Flavobacterium psychrophilum]|uniref:hypothetical protein n=1 Tax=Flavobacterium psychrophilum TaxID=96345 RepID=UPI000B7C490E|nr:hypothetical protein [Flavobacterium psychrophilum]EKT4498921.1 hypothetical protein [Flavobacterium psychrophilum]ELM3651135.1 hypothetical protein [Flavobacterium psychrophilum]ELM3672308.1 hypothetical protein [Flavobacterium psychrophilum]ELM3726645.1 hypothetical protein [Flavobacterium psychrophilum]ELY1978711.1 hypothetical protein [Flavobacterium psychrophilum]